MRRSECVVLGAGGHAKVVTECLEDSGYHVVFYFVDEPAAPRLMAAPVKRMEELPDIVEQYGIEYAFPAIGDNKVRGKWQRDLIVNRVTPMEIPTAISSAAYVSRHSFIEEGTVVMPKAVIEPAAVVREGCIINTGASVGHDSEIGAFTHLAPGARIGGGCKIGNNCLIGINAAVNAHITIGDNNIIPSGKAIIMDMPAKKEKK